MHSLEDLMFPGLTRYSWPDSILTTSAALGSSIKQAQCGKRIRLKFDIRQTLPSTVILCMSEHVVALVLSALTAPEDVHGTRLRESDMTRYI